MLDLRTVASRLRSSRRSGTKGMRAVAAIAAAILIGATFGACSSESAGGARGNTAQQEAEQTADENSDVDDTEDTADDTGDTDDTDAADDAAGAQVGSGGVFDGIPVIDGEVTHDQSGTLTNGGTDYRGVGIATGLDWRDAADQVREQLVGAELTELVWATAAGMEGETSQTYRDTGARGLYEHGGVVLKLQVDPDGEVSYDAHEMPSGSFAEKDFACQVLHKTSASSLSFTLMPQVSGNPITEQDVDFTFAYSDALESRVPADVSAALAGMRDAAEQTVGLPADELQPGNDADDPIADARDALNEATDAFCSA